MVTCNVKRILSASHSLLNFKHDYRFVVRNESKLPALSSFRPFPACNHPFLQVAMASLSCTAKASARDLSVKVTQVQVTL